MLYRLRNKKTGEILPEDHHLYTDSYVDPYGVLLYVYQDEDGNGELGYFVSETHLEDYEAVLPEGRKENGNRSGT